MEKNFEKIVNLKNEILGRVNNLNVWQRGDERAPHKPLLIILALARITQGFERLAPFVVIEEPLRRLLRDFGPPRRSHHPHYPFWYLQTDGLWEVPGGSTLKSRRGKDEPLKSELVKNNIEGGFPERIYELFKSDRKFLNNVVDILLDAHFPSSLHEDVLTEVGLPVQRQIMKTARDPMFRHAVIQAYEHSCAICSYDIKMGTSDLALEAAHIKWFQAGGPDEVQNGLALCVLHHKALDRGAVGFDDSLRIMISADIHGRSWLSNFFLSFKGKKLRQPHSKNLLPKREYIQWHRKEVFKFPARE
jgi:putative restriction endonuclease